MGRVSLSRVVLDRSHVCLYTHTQTHARLHTPSRQLGINTGAPLATPRLLHMGTCYGAFYSDNVMCVYACVCVCMCVCAANSPAPAPYGGAEGVVCVQRTSSGGERAASLQDLPLDVLLLIVKHMAPRVPDVSVCDPSDMVLPPEPLMAQHLEAVAIIQAHYAQLQQQGAAMVPDAPEIILEQEMQA